VLLYIAVLGNSKGIFRIKGSGRTTMSARHPGQATSGGGRRVIPQIEAKLTWLDELEKSVER
jgi:hypothetical protein